MEITLNNNLKPHAFLALVVSFWLVIFLVFISPFDVSDLPFMIRIILMPMYGVIFFLSYMLGFGVQFLWYSRNKRWTLVNEAVVLVLIYLTTFFLSWLYYKTDWINGTYDFYTFGISVFLPIGLILSIGFLFGRYYINKSASRVKSNKITLFGNNKKEILKIEPNQIIGVSGAQNYVDLHILEGGQVKKVVFRNTLKAVHAQCQGLIKVHRSFLVNPIHFTRWIDNQNANFNGLHVPISKKYKEDLENRIS